MLKKKRKINIRFINLAFIIVLFICLVIYMFVVDDIKSIIKVITTMKYEWLIIAFLFMVVYWLLEALCLFDVTKKIYKNEKYKTSFRISMIGQLFNCITPFSSGGQPIQALAMVNDKKSLSNSASILLIKFIVYQATLVIYTLVLMVFKYSYFKTLVSNFVYLALIGFLVNLGVIVFLVLIGVNEKFVYGFLEKIYRFLHKIKVIKDVDSHLEKLKNTIANFHDKFKIIKKEKWLIVRLVIYTIMQLTVFFLVTFAIYKAFSLSGAGVLNIISAQAILMMIMAFIPTPGAGIAAEGGFAIIFSTFFEGSNINMAILFWRIYTFYFPIIFGAIALAINNKKTNKKIKLDTKGVDINEI